MRALPFAIGMSLGLVLDCAHGQDLKAAQACTRVGEDISRLACYDAAFGVSRPPSAQKSMTAAPPAAVAFGDNAALHPGSKTDLPKSMTVHVQQAESLAYGLYRLSLENGQVWRTTEEDSALEFKANDLVTLSRRVMGGYEISLTGHHASVNATRLK